MKDWPLFPEAIFSNFLIFPRLGKVKPFPGWLGTPTSYTHTRLSVLYMETDTLALLDCIVLWTNLCDQSSISSARSRDTSLPALSNVQQMAPRSLNDRPRKPRLEKQRISRHATPRGAAIWWSVQKLREWIELCHHVTQCCNTCISFLTTNNVSFCFSATKLCRFSFRFC